MPDATKLVKAMKKAALDAMESTKPCGVFFGEIKSENPLKVLVEQKMLLSEEQLILTRNVTEFDVDISVDHETENQKVVHSHAIPTGSSGPVDIEHKHAYYGRKTFTVHNGLVEGEKVILMRMNGGQKYVVLDRIG